MRARRARAGVRRVRRRAVRGSRLPRAPERARALASHVRDPDHERNSEPPASNSSRVETQASQEAGRREASAELTASGNTDHNALLACASDVAESAHREELALNPSST